MAIEGREGEELVIRADLPGINPESDIEIVILHDVLHIRAYREAGPEPPEHPSDLRYGSFIRDIALPAGTREHEVSATYRAGVLEVRAPVGEGEAVDARIVPVQCRDAAP